MTTATTAALKTWTIGTVTVTVELNPDWTKDSEYESRYFVVTTDQDGEITLDGADDRDEAMQMGADAVEAIEGDMKDARESRASDLSDVAGDWDAGDDRDAVEALAALVSKGKAGLVLAALKAAGLA